MRMRDFVPSCYNNPQAAYSFSKVLWFCQLYPRESSLLGMEKENIPPTKKAKVSLSLKKSRKPRFQPVSEDKLKGMTVPYVPKNTEQSSKWAPDKSTSRCFINLVSTYSIWYIELMFTSVNRKPCYIQHESLIYHCSRYITRSEALKCGFIII